MEVEPVLPSEELHHALLALGESHSIFNSRLARIWLTRSSFRWKRCYSTCSTSLLDRSFRNFPALPSRHRFSRRAQPFPLPFRACDSSLRRTFSPHLPSPTCEAFKRSTYLLEIHSSSLCKPFTTHLLLFIAPLAQTPPNSTQMDERSSSRCFLDGSW